MKRFKVFILSTPVIVSCTADKSDMNTMVHNFADIECRAMLLREKRFALANEIRFTQDTILRPSNKTDTTRLKTKLQVLNTEKDSMLQTSLILADSIKHQLDSLMQYYLTKPVDKSKFNQQLNTALQKKGCIEKPK